MAGRTLTRPQIRTANQKRISMEMRFFPFGGEVWAGVVYGAWKVSLKLFSIFFDFPLARTREL